MQFSWMIDEISMRTMRHVIIQKHRQLRLPSSGKAACREVVHERPTWKLPAREWTAERSTTKVGVSRVDARGTD